MLNDYYLKKIKTQIKRFIKIEYRRMTIRCKKIQEYPKVIQLPITHLCNFDCVMCGMHHMIRRNDFSADELGIILSDDLYKEVEAVGVNGGEPFLKKDIVACIKMIIDRLTNLKEIDIISNGYCSERIIEVLSQIRFDCKKHNIRLNISFSVDGIYDMHDFHRGHEGSFKNVCNTINMIMRNKEEFADSIDIITTITRYNIFRINEVDVWAKKNRLNVAYNIATVNARIENEDREKDFSVLSDEKTRMLAQEFFYSKYRETGSERYYAIFLFLKTGIRYDICPCMFNEWITVTPDSQISFCATHSKKLGSGLDNSSYEIVKRNLPYLEQIREKYCLHCSHYIYGLNVKGLRMMYRDMKENEYLR